jgi:hypothetical protein
MLERRAFERAREVDIADLLPPEERADEHRDDHEHEHGEPEHGETVARERIPGVLPERTGRPERGGVRRRDDLFARDARHQAYLIRGSRTA